MTTNARIFPDALLLTDSPRSIPSGESLLIWLEVESEGTRAGVYEYDVSAQVGDASHKIPLSVHVHDVTLSLETPLATGNWSDLNDGEFAMAKPVRDEMLANRMTIGAGGGVWPMPKKNEQGELIRPVEQDTTALDKFIEFHKDFPQLSIFIAFNQHIELPTYDWFGPVTWMDDEFKAIFREWIGGIIDRFKAGGRDYDEFIHNVYWPMVYPIGPGYPKPPADVQTAEQVVPSRRWEYVRMGIEDYMLLKMARERIEKLGTTGAAHPRMLDEIVKTVVVNRDADRELFRRKRRELVELVEAIAP